MKSHAPGEVDYLLALAAGPASWSEGADTPTWLRLSLAAEVLLLAIIVLAATVEAVLRDRAVFAVVVLVLGGLAAWVCVSAEITLSISRPRRRPRRHTYRALVRVLGASSLLAVWFELVGTHVPIATLLLGLPTGIDVACTLQILGHVPTGRRLFWRAVLSPLHAAVLTVVFLAAVLQARDQGHAVVVGFYLTFMSTTIVAVGVYAFWSRLLSQAFDTNERERDELNQHHHRELAHWLHDDVCAEIRLLRLRTEREELDDGQLGAELDRIDHQLRMTQLDQTLRGGSATVAEILQPFLRRAQSAGVALIEVPGFEIGRTVLEEQPGRLLQRATAVFVSNALNAGTHVLRIRLTIGFESLFLEVEDDAGGIPEVHHTLGRGLSTLEAELGEGRMSIVSNGLGTVATATIRVVRPTSTTKVRYTDGVPQ